MIILISVVVLVVVGGMITLLLLFFNRDFKVTPNSITIASEGGVVSLEVDGPGNWKVLSVSEPWVYVDAGNGMLNLGASENEGIQRSATISIGNDYKSCTVTVLQESGAFYATPSNVQVSPSSSTEYFTIEGQKEWIVAEGPAGWGHVSRNGNQLVWQVDENTGDEREDMVLLQSGSKTLALTLVQGAALSAEKMNLTGGGSEHTAYIEIYGPSDWDIYDEPYFTDCSREGNRVRIDFDKNDEEEVRERDLVISGGGQKISITIKQNKYSSGVSYPSFPSYPVYPYYF